MPPWKSTCSAISASTPIVGWWSATPSGTGSPWRNTTVYGLPTRLLDWTDSPFAALHFATSQIEEFDTDGVVWGVNYLLTHQLVPERLRTRLDQEGANVFTVEMLSER